MSIAYLGLGSNMADKEGNIRFAVQEINKRIGKVVSLSALYITEPVGFQSENNFVNAVCGVETKLSPRQLLEATEDIERRAGRDRKSIAGIHEDRLLDIDILLYDDFVLITDRLTIPHPQMSVRQFVMKPLVEIAPDLVHPVLEENMRDLLKKI